MFPCFSLGAESAKQLLQKTMHQCKRQYNGLDRMGIVGAKFSPHCSAFTLQRSNTGLRWHENGNKILPMKIKCFTMVMVMVSFGLCAQAQDSGMQTNPPAQSTAYSADYVHHFGVGLEFGAPIGVTAKYWLTDICALDGAVGWSPYSHSSAEIHADFLVHNFDILTPSSGKLPFYIGGGILGRIRNDGRSNLAGFRFPIGVSYMFENCPFDVFAEVAPEIIFAPFGRGSVDSSIGFRYWF
jgi:hypothetical protein